ncbi:ribosomal protein S18-alanine N-acetyltransferase [Vibrio sp. S9_S30]|uniref:ribosomal protein S18-alanine N-acetyltransferase n=1 Tax=Vibrio sp. S9_S30 TaxID=2720226 RepID=UPI00168196F7|nr:ribosomal protein S18-alanine N-acetyltransferase [Vibrio sp. S9_S30]MBD1557773.1 ribosomal protein S18-alanine N-acetyltransferase [Vibrio sp. S9_S30]
MEYRHAQLDDLDSLLHLENQVFTSDNINRRQMKRFIQSHHCQLFVAKANEQLAGYALVLFNQATQLARIYSIAVSPNFRGQGIAEQLINRCEKGTVERGYITLRLEVREDNLGAIRLYEKHGFKPLKTLIHYYDDLVDGLRMQKRLGTPGPQLTLAMPLYIQTLPFTCGAACLLMSFAALGHPTPPTRKKEVQLWREATTIFMAGGHGGCSGQGLALAAYRRGFSVELWSHSHGIPFIQSVRDPLKKSVIELVHADFMDQIEQTEIQVTHAPPHVEQIENWLKKGAAVLLLISTYRFNGYKEPHWIVLSGMSEQFFYFHDPLVEETQDAVSSAYIPIGKNALEQIVGFGKQKHTACVVIFPTPP